MGGEFHFLLFEKGAGQEWEKAGGYSRPASLCQMD